MSNNLTPKTDFNEPLAYQIRIKGRLGREWADWFGSLTITPQENGETLITGSTLDQPALYGLLKKVRDLGLPLISVNCIGYDPSIDLGADPSTEAGTSQADAPDATP